MPNDTKNQVDEPRPGTPEYEALQRLLDARSKEPSSPFSKADFDATRQRKAVNG